MNNKVWLLIAGICLLGMGYFGGKVVNKKPEVKEEVTAIATPTVQMMEKGTISGYLIYPSSYIPDEMGVCAQNIETPELLNCVKQIKDKKYKTGVGYEMDLSPGSYYVYSFYKDMKAYYNEYVICGLKAECSSHTKIPVVVTAGSNQDQILPHDWYDNSPTVKPSATLSPTPTSKILKPIVTLVKINPDVLKLVPSATPTLVKIVVPSIKINIPQW